MNTVVVMMTAGEKTGPYSMPLIFYDLAKKPPLHAWVHSTWKARLALNYLGIPYETRFLEFPEVEPLLKSLGLPPHEDSRQRWAVPAVTYGDKHVMGEAATEVPLFLQSLSSKPLQLKSPAVKRAENASGQAMGPLRTIWMPALFALLNPESQQRFSHRKLRLARDTATDEAAWEMARPHLKELGALLRESDAPYVLDEVSYADFVVVGMLQFFHVADIAIYNRAVRETPELGRLYDACSPYLDRDT